MNVHLPLKPILIVLHALISNMISLDLGFPICQTKEPALPLPARFWLPGCGADGLALASRGSGQPG